MTAAEIIRLIEHWQLKEARQEYEKNVQSLSDEERSRIEDLLQKEESVVAQVQAAVEQIGTEPAVAVENLRKLAVDAQGLPDYEEAVKQAIQAVETKRREDVLQLCADAKELAKIARKWREAETKVTEAKQIYPSWASDTETREAVHSADKAVTDAEEADKKLAKLDRALNDEKISEAQGLLNELRDVYKVLEEELKARENKLEDIRIRAGGKSTRQQYDTDIENLRAAQRSLEGSKNWRGAYNNLRRLIDALAREGKTEEATQEGKKAERYLEALRASIYKTIDDRLDAAGKALEKGYLTQARTLVKAAIHAGDPPKQDPELPIDVAGKIEIKSEQDQRANNILSQIDEKEKIREEARKHMDEAFRCLGKHTLQGLYDARDLLQRVEGLDPTYPGLGTIKTDVASRIETMVQAESERLGSLLMRSISRGDVKGARKYLEDMRALGLKAEDIVSYQQEVERANERRDTIAGKRQAFEALFNDAQDRLDCDQTMQIEDARKEWEKVAFDVAGPTQAKARVERFSRTCSDLSSAKKAVEEALLRQDGVDTRVADADKLAMSDVGKRPKIASLLAHFWQAMAEQHGEHGAELTYLRKAQRFADLSEDADLQERTRSEIAQIQSRTKEGRHLAKVEEILRNFLENDDVESALQLIATLPEDDPARLDSTTALLIAQVKQRDNSRQAQKLYDAAKKRAEEGTLLEAKQMLEDSISKAYTTDASILQTTVEQALRWEAEIRQSLDDALDVDISDPEKISPDKREKLIEGKVRADAVMRRTGPRSAVLNDKASRVTKNYNLWYTHFDTRLDELNKEIKDLINSLEFDEALNRLDQVEKAGVPDDLRSRVVDLRSKVESARQITKPIFRTLPDE